MGSDYGPAVPICITIVILSIVLIGLLVGLSINRANYYEYALGVSRVYGTVDRSKVYYHKAYLTTPDTYFMVYPSTFIHEKLENLTAWSKSSSIDAGAEIKMSVSFQYQLKKDEVGLLYNKVGQDFQPFIKNLAIDAIKNQATNFSSDALLMNRRLVERTYFKVVSDSLSRNAHTNVLSLQLRDIEFSDQVYKTRLTAAIQYQKNSGETYNKEAILTRGATNELVTSLENEAKEVLQKSVATATLLLERARNKALRIEQEARSKGLDHISERLNITVSKHLLSLDFLVSLDGHSSYSYAGFDDIVKSIP